jgi:hypothetical protein
MLLLDFQSQNPVGLDRQTSSVDGVDVSLTAGGHLAFSTTAETFEILIRRGRVWLTDGPIDHVLNGPESHDCPTRSRVVITALTDASLTVRVKQDR